MKEFRIEIKIEGQREEIIASLKRTISALDASDWPNTVGASDCHSIYIGPSAATIAARLPALIARGLI